MRVSDAVLHAKAVVGHFEIEFEGIRMRGYDYLTNGNTLGWSHANTTQGPSGVQ